ncbi:GIY-YIG nuclease family protein [Acidovorax sp. sic0104]|uniref:GIY-YIG nuclease family protein n=2 Tax=Acidovorax sp. sic0104 TaxID=2854784 RepID=UPI001C4459BB|nr:GIY-YIG nuclease family protein [Acidovorax sp. sic0104]MBV7542043.1 GIY-YIG nuclease family protein [Acidovorax sp. sic0104]
MPGYLYMARNPFHLDGLFKLGYTTRSPQERIDSLNLEHREVPDVGEFHLVHSVQVPAAYDAERALFDLLAPNRPVQKREFFLLREPLLKRALDATQAFTNGDAEALDDFVLHRDQGAAFASPALVEHAAIPPLRSPGGGWIYVTRCQWHRKDLFRISYTRTDPRLALSALDARQKRFTSRIGFHTLVHCVCVDDLGAVWGTAAASLDRWRVLGSKVFFEAPLGDLSEAINRSIPAAVELAVPLKHGRNFGDVTVELVLGKASGSWAAWARPCPSCGSVLRFTGTVGAQGLVECPGCGCELECTVGASKAVVSAQK